MIIPFNNFTWGASSSFIYLAPFIVFSIGALFYRFRWQKKTAHLLQSSPGLLLNFSLRRKVVKTALLIAALLSLVLALARPQSAARKENIDQQGRNVLIALDVSRSMLAQDLKPSRLLLAKEKIKELAQGLSAERIALMLFSDAPFIQCPFTSDISAFLSFLDLVDVESISTGTTALDKALSQALELFSRVTTSRNNIMVIFTDGEDFSPHLTGLKERAQKIGLHIFTIGIGTVEGAPIPLYNEQGTQIGHQKDKDGSVVISRLNEKLLSELATNTGAEFIPASQDRSDMRRLISDIQRFEKEAFAPQEVEVKQENYGIFALIGFVLLLLEWVL